VRSSPCLARLVRIQSPPHTCAQLPPATALADLSADSKLRAGGAALDQLLFEFDEDFDGEVNLQEWISKMPAELLHAIEYAINSSGEIEGFADKHKAKQAMKAAAGEGLDEDSAATKLQSIQRGKNARVGGGPKKLQALGPVGGGGGGGLLPSLPEPSSDDLRAKFDALDSTRDGAIDKAELYDALQALMPDTLPEVLKPLVQSEFSKADADMSGALSFEEFAKLHAALGLASMGARQAALGGGDESQAATKIQAIHRGKLQRAELTGEPARLEAEAEAAKAQKAAAS
jgi:Ca2+-binding EF-hand superfamily protein